MTPVDLDFEDDEVVVPPPAAHHAPPPPPLPTERFEDALPVKAAVRDIAPRPAPARTLPHSPEAEEQLLSCCLLDGSPTLAACIEHRLPTRAFYTPANRTIYGHLLTLHAAHGTVETSMLAESLTAARQLETIGGIPYLLRITAAAPTTANASFFIARLRDLYQRRELIATATHAVERAFEGDNAADILPATLTTLATLAAPVTRQPTKKPSEFNVVSANHSSVLLGNRYLNRGDGIILSGTSGMGKSSMELQMAITWALGESFHGIRPNGPLRSLIIQSEDSDGDVAEVVQSICHVLKLTADQRAALDANILIVTDRVNRGQPFIAALRRHIEAFGPDLVWINPLQAFIDGDVTESRDLGNFLRSGLNGLNNECRFGYMIIHHTTKPATGRDKAERLWHEVMYDMAGGAELINWARGIISLRPQEAEGEFKMVLAKRGRRAGVIKEVEQGAGTRLEVVTTIGLKHHHGEFLPGTSIPVIFWDSCTVAESPKREPSCGRPEKYAFADYRNIFPSHDSEGMTLAVLHRALSDNGVIPKNNLHSICKRWADDGLVEIIDVSPKPRRYRKAK